RIHRLLDPERAQVAPRLVERDRERAVHHEWPWTGKHDATDPAGDLDGVRDSGLLDAPERDTARFELVVATLARLGERGRGGQHEHGDDGEAHGPSVLVRPAAGQIYGDRATARIRACA